MGLNSKIPYVTATWDPIEGCAPCSPGCVHCWARTLARRFANNPALSAQTREAYRSIASWGGTLAEFPERWPDPRRWQRPQRILVGSRSDCALWRTNMLRLVACYSVRIHQYLVLTKRPAILASKVGDLLKTFWVGTTVCNQAEADAKIPDLLAIPAAGHWLSVEPMLGPVELMESDLCQDDRCAHGRISWVVCGGESGRNATPLEPRWAGDIRDQCVAAGVPFWFKQWSTSPGQTFSCDADAAAWKAGRATLDGVTYNELPAALMLPGEIDAPTSHHTKS